MSLSFHSFTPTFWKPGKKCYISLIAVFKACDKGATHSLEVMAHRQLISHFLYSFKGGEWSDSSKFALCTIICHAFFPLGLMILSGIAFFIRNWRILQMVLFSPLILVLGLFYWLVFVWLTLKVAICMIFAVLSWVKTNVILWHITMLTWFKTTRPDYLIWKASQL